VISDACTQPVVGEHVTLHATVGGDCTAVQGATEATVVVVTEEEQTSLERTMLLMVIVAFGYVVELVINVPAVEAQ
jgi:hypothetical protein